MATIDVNRTTLHYTIDAPPTPGAETIVFSHSLFFDTRMFAAQVARFSRSHRVVCYDHRGQGQSAAAPRAELDMNTLTDHAAALIEALGLAPCTFVGNSMGGFVALRLAARRPELLRSAVVLGSAASAEAQADAFDELSATLSAGGVAPVLDIIAHIMLG